MLNLCRFMASCFHPHCHSSINQGIPVLTICGWLVTGGWETGIYQFIQQTTQCAPDALIWAGKLEGHWWTGSGSSINWHLNLQTCRISKKGRAGQSSPWLYAEFNCSPIEVTVEFSLSFETLMGRLRSCLLRNHQLLSHFLHNLTGPKILPWM